MALSSNDPGYIRFAGPVVTNNTVPVDVLNRTLQSLQQIILLIAASEEAKFLPPKRFRPSEALRRKCELRVGVSTPGSLRVPLWIRDTDLGIDLLKKLHAFLFAVAGTNAADMQQAIPDSFYREKAIREAIECLPRAGQLWHADFSVDDMAPVRLDQRLRESIEEIVESSRDEDDSEVIAELVSINFAKETVTLLYTPTQKKLTCNYPVDKEDRLFGSRRLNVRVIGLFDRDDNGSPIKCVRVDSIEPFDLSPFMVDQIRRNARVLTISPPLELTPQQDEESRGAVIFATDQDLKLHVYAKTKNKLIEETEDYLFFLWDAYANNSSEALDDIAKSLAETLRLRIKESIISKESPNDA